MAISGNSEVLWSVFLKELLPSFNQCFKDSTCAVGFYKSHFLCNKQAALKLVLVTDSKMLFHFKLIQADTEFQKPFQETSPTNPF